MPKVSARTGTWLPSFKGLSQLPQHGPDSIHSWLIAGACSMCCFFAMAGRRSSGFLYVSILDTFHVNRQDGSWPLMIMGALIYLSGLITGPLAHRFTARPVIIAGALIASVGAMLCYFATTIEFLTVTLGVVHAIGSGMIFVVSPTFINEHFVKNKGLAMGINFTGVTMATFVFPKLLEYLTNKFGFRGCLLIFGAIILNALAFSLFLRRPGWVKTAALHSTEGSTLKSVDEALELKGSNPVQKKQTGGTFRQALSVFTYPIFYVLMYSFVVYSFGFECYISLFVDFAVDRGVFVSSAVTMLSMSAIADVAGRLTLPMAADKGLLTNRSLITITFICFGVLFLVLPYIHSYGLLFAIAIALAYFVGTILVLFPVLLAEYLGLERVSMAYGMVIASAGFFSFAKPSVIGYYRDEIGAYDTLFTICGSLILFGAFMWIVVLALEANRNKKVLNLQPDCPQEDVTVTKLSRDRHMDV
ncbi:monocarboxylate transporter 9 [Ixodes scapularis]